MAFGCIPAFCKYELFMERYRSGAEVIRNQIALTADTKILDVGCGEGYMKYFFGMGAGRWFGVERGEERAKECRNLGYQVAEINLNESFLPYPDEFFDVVVASHVIEHLSKIDFCLKEMDRVLKKGGVMLLATPTKPPGADWLINLFYRTQPKIRDDTHRAFSVFSLKRFVARKLPYYRLVDGRGFRIFSARKKLPLENQYWFYRFSTFLGLFLTPFVPEVNLIYKKNSDETIASTAAAFQNIRKTR